jgi:hypothetical protein
LIGSAKWVRMALKSACADGSLVAPQPPGKALTAHREQVGEDAVAPQRHRFTHAIFHDRGYSSQRALERISGAAMGGLGRFHRGICLKLGPSTRPSGNSMTTLAGGARAPGHLDSLDAWTSQRPKSSVTALVSLTAFSGK